MNTTPPTTPPFRIPPPAFKKTRASLAGSGSQTIRCDVAAATPRPYHLTLPYCRQSVIGGAPLGAAFGQGRFIFGIQSPLPEAARKHGVKKRVHKVGRLGTFP